MNSCKESGTHSFLIEYANKINSGEIPACWWIKLQYKLLLEDIEKQMKFSMLKRLTSELDSLRRSASIQNRHSPGNLFI